MRADLTWEAGRMELGTVRAWDARGGWGVLDCAATPGGCWADARAIVGPVAEPLRSGSRVVFEFAEEPHDGYDFRATVVWPEGRVRGAAPAPVRVFRSDALAAADPTPGMDRQRAFELPMLWSGQVETAPGAVSGWHHHARNDSSLYVVRGVLRLEFEGHDGHLDAGPGDFVHVPAWTVHRESNPTDQPSLAVIARVGGDTPTVNVEGPPRP
jgi:quercetin dioxygenase-like cupin family protein